jgi:hypothetical protein
LVPPHANHESGPAVRAMSEIVGRRRRRFMRGAYRVRWSIRMGSFAQTPSPASGAKADGREKFVERQDQSLWGQQDQTIRSGCGGVVV